MVFLGEATRVALESLWAYKLRTVLTVLANVVAVASVIAVASLGRGLDLHMRREIAAVGTNVLTVSRVDDLQILTNLEEYLDSLHNPRLTFEDYRALRDANLPGVESCSAMLSELARVEAPGRSVERVRVEGWTADYPLFKDIRIAAGRHFNVFEAHHSRPVAVIGSDIAKRILASERAVGRTIRVNGRSLEVVGVLAEKAGVLGANPNLVVYVPLGRLQKVFGPRRSLSVQMKIADLNTMDGTKERVRRFLRTRRGLKPAERDDFAITSSREKLSFYGKIAGPLLGALISLVSISLVVGGIVIMNTMLVSVRERTREIGLRKAVGARWADIVRQFLAESVVIALVGGCVGTALGFMLANGISVGYDLPFAVESIAVVSGIVVATLVGVFFGIYPAGRAARLDPVEALRHE
jgi:putative ABC transport system permease protein